jgi:type I restriction enzyme S subunit
MVMSDLPNGRALAKAYLVEADDTYAVNQRVCALTAYRDWPEYLFYVLNRSPYFLKFDDGVNQTHLLNPVFKKCPLALPPTVEEQRAIATALSDVDGLLGGMDRLIAKKRDLKQAAMQQLLTGQTRLPGFHREWEALTAGEIGVFRGGNGFSLDAQGESGGDYPFFKVSDMNNEGNDTFMTTANHWISEKTRKRLGATAFPKDGIVFAKVGAAIFLERKKILGQASCIDNNMAAFVLDKSRAHVGFVHALLLSKKLGSLVATTALPALNGKQLGEIAFTLPPLPEQIAIAEVLTDMEAELAALEQRREKTRALKQAMMQELLTGRTRLISPKEAHA